MEDSARLEKLLDFTVWGDITISRNFTRDGLYVLKASGDTLSFGDDMKQLIDNAPDCDELFETLVDHARAIQ